MRQIFASELTCSGNFDTQGFPEQVMTQKVEGHSLKQYDSHDSPKNVMTHGVEGALLYKIGDSRDSRGEGHSRKLGACRSIDHKGT